MAKEAYLYKKVVSGEATMDYTASAAISAGDVVNIDLAAASLGVNAVRTIAGVATTDIANGSTGAVDITNIYSVDTSTAFAEGDPVYWDESANKAIAYSAVAAGDFCLGTCVETKTGTDGQVKVRLNWGPDAFFQEPVA